VKRDLLVATPLAAVVAAMLAAASMAAAPLARAAVTQSSPAPAHGACADLIELELPDTTIVKAEEVRGPSFATPDGTSLDRLPGFCRVSARTSPAVNFEVWLPLQDWSGRFQVVGNGANAGSISYGAMATALRRGYAVGSTDTGHATRNARDASWAVGHPELLVDFGHRAVHVTTGNGKKVVEAFYHEPARRSYYVGCSTGGRQGMMEAQRYPDDFDGIIAGAPAFNWTRFQAGGHLWAVLATNKDPESYIPTAKLRLLGDAVNAACDAGDGIRDGVLDDPRTCRFDPQTLACAPGADPASCFTPKQIKAVKDIWAGSRNAAGEVIYPGYLPGAESAGGWASYTTGTGPLTGNHYEQADNVLKYMVFGNPKWDFRTFDYEKDLPAAIAKFGPIMDAFNPDLSGVRRHGAKLILYHGWNDPSISPLNTINYYDNVIAELQQGRSREQAAAEVQEFARLFLVPGMLHCTGGPGPNSFDMLTALENWVEKGVPPDQVIAAHETKGVVDRTRPLCAYPKVAVYNGSGSTDDAANFACRASRGQSPG
jgi:feruloyl esterase